MGKESNHSRLGVIPVEELALWVSDTTHSKAYEMLSPGRRRILHEGILRLNDMPIFDTTHRGSDIPNEQANRLLGLIDELVPGFFGTCFEFFRLEDALDHPKGDGVRPAAGYSGRNPFNTR